MIPFAAGQIYQIRFWLHDKGYRKDQSNLAVHFKHKPNPTVDMVHGGTYPQELLRVLIHKLSYESTTTEEKEAVHHLRSALFLYESARHVGDPERSIEWLQAYNKFIADGKKLTDAEPCFMCGYTFCTGHEFPD